MFIINCDNKGCMKAQAALLNTISGKVVCIECGGDITNITAITKNQLKFAGQTTKNTKSQDPYATKCQDCLRDGTPKLVKGKFHCKFCNTELTKLTESFKIVLKGALVDKV